MNIQQFPDDARIWIFTSDRMIAPDEQDLLKSGIEAFLQQWAAHGTQLYAACSWLNTYQLVIALDEEKAGASGCSIDALTRFMRETGAQHAIDWFNRLTMVVEDGGEVHLVSFFELGEHPEGKLFDPLVQRLGEIRSNWPVRISESRYKHLVA